MVFKVGDKEKKKKNKVFKELVYEMRYGSPIYYREYDKVISGEKTLEEVMGSGGLQSYLIALIVSLLFNRLSDKYYILANEVGYKFAPRSWYNLDIAIVDKSKLDELPEGYISIPPKIVIEVDTKADLRKFKVPQDYFHRKTQDLIDSGVEKVIWIFTKEKKIWIAESGKDWRITNWGSDIDIVDGVILNLEKLLEEK